MLLILCIILYVDFHFFGGHSLIHTFFFVIFYFLVLKDQDFSLQWVIILQKDV